MSEVNVVDIDAQLDACRVQEHHKYSKWRAVRHEQSVCERRRYREWRTVASQLQRLSLTIHESAKHVSL